MFASVASGVLAGWWVLMLSIGVGLQLSDRARKHEALESSIGKVESAIGEVGSAVESVESTVEEVKSTVGDVASDVAEVRSAVAGIESSVEDVESRIEIVESSVDRVESLFGDAILAIAQIDRNAGAASGTTEVVIGEMNLQVINRNTPVEPGGDRANDSNAEPAPETGASVDSVDRVEFETGSHLIGEAQQGAVARVEEKIRKEDEDRSRTDDILVLGFADSCGPAVGNLNLSERRAESVAADLANRLDERTIHVFGMGEIAGAFGEGLCDSRSHRSARVFLLTPDGEGG